MKKNSPRSEKARPAAPLRPERRDRPAPREILRKVRRIEIVTRSLVSDIFSGEYKSVFRGRGMEFDEVREYTPGDDIRAIDWNVSARMNHLFVKRYVEERELTVILVVDASGSSEFGTRQSLKNDLSAEIGGLLAFAAQKNNDKVGLVLFTDRIETFLPPKKGMRHALRVVRDLVYHEPVGSGTDIGGALEHVSRVLHRRAIVFLISDFQGTGYEKALRTASKRHDLVAIWVSDRREREIPKRGRVRIEDPETGEELLLELSPRGAESYRRLAETRRREIEKLMRSCRVDCIPVATEGSYVEPLVAFFKKRERMFR